MAERLPRLTIQRVEIAGYKSIAETQLDLRRINVLVGANGAGKSNFISFFQMLAASLDARLDGYVGAQGGAEACLHQGAKETRQIRCALRVHTEAGIGTLHQKLVFRPPDTLTYGTSHARDWVSETAPTHWFTMTCARWLKKKAASTPGNWSTTASRTASASTTFTTRLCPVRCASRQRLPIMPGFTATPAICRPCFTCTANWKRNRSATAEQAVSRLVVRADPEDGQEVLSRVPRFCP